MLGTHSSPPIHAVASGFAPTLIRALTAPVAGSMRTIVPGLARDPQRAGRGGDPVGVRDRPALRDAAARRVELQQLAAAVVADPQRAVRVQQPVRLGARVEALRRRLFVRGSMRETVPSPEFETQTLPPPAASPYGRAPTGMRATTRFVRRVDPRDRAAVEVRDPDAAGRGEHRERPRAGRDAGQRPCRSRRRSARAWSAGRAPRPIPAAAPSSPTLRADRDLRGLGGRPRATTGRATPERDADSRPTRSIRMTARQTTATLRNYQMADTGPETILFDVFLTNQRRKAMIARALEGTGLPPEDYPLYVFVGAEGPVDADRPRGPAGHAALDGALPRPPPGAPRPRRADPEPGGRPLVPDPPHRRGAAPARGCAARRSARYAEAVEAELGPEQLDASSLGARRLREAIDDQA